MLLGIEELFGMWRALDQQSDVLLDVTLCVGSAVRCPVGCDVLNDLYPSQIALEGTAHEGWHEWDM